MFLNAMLARFAVLVPVSMGMFALTYLRWFKDPVNILKWDRQLCRRSYMGPWMRCNRIAMAQLAILELA